MFFTGLGKRLLTGLLFLCLCCTAQKSVEYKSVAPALKRMIELNHCNPRVMDEAVAKALLKDFINRLDEEHLYFTQADVKQIEDALPLMLQELDGKNHLFLNRIIGAYKVRLALADTAIALACKKPFDFKATDEIVFANDSSSFAATEAELEARRTKWLKYQTLYRLSNLLRADSTLTTGTVMRFESAQRDLAGKNARRKIKQMQQQAMALDNYVNYLFCGAVANVFDPHTEFFPATDRENFLGAVNGESYKFGLQLNTNDKDEVEIEHIQPGSPAWKCGVLNKNDVLLQLQWQGRPAVDLMGADEEEVSRVLAESNHDRLDITVRKANGMQKTVSLRKEKVREEENFVKSFVLAGEKRLGYIVLPGFYTEWETKSGSSCANDVAKEILKLKKENIEGLVLDLRNNGGGSMEEAMQLSGIFIEEGVLGFVKEKTGKPMALKDPNRGTVYDGPLLVMVNGSSASASEVVAGALQDYNRAVVVGSPTYGKATMQVILAIDTNLDIERAGNSTGGNYDYVKVTVGKLYRVNGSSNQLRGVVPDVVLPDISGLLNYREASQNFALPYDTVKRALYYNPLAPLPAKELLQKSASRMSASEPFKLVKQSQQAFANMYKNEAMPLQLDAYVSRQKATAAEWLKLVEQLEKPAQAVYTVQNHGDDKQRFAADAYLNELNREEIKSVTNDVYLHESFLILADLINLSK